MATDANETNDLTIRTDDPPKPGASTALAIQRAGTMQQAFAGLMPSSVGEVMVLATHLAKSKAIPKTLREAGADTVFTVIWAGMELGLTPIRSMQSITNISGTLCMKADLQLALAQNRAVLAFYEEGFEEKGKTDSNLPKRDPAGDAAGQGAEFGRPGRTGGGEDPVGGRSDWRPASPTAGRWGTGSAGTTRCRSARSRSRMPNGRSSTKPTPTTLAARRKKPLSEKFNYKSFPGDMYPKRARTRLLQVLAPDATNGLPAAEQLEGGQIIDAEFTVQHSTQQGEPAGTTWTP
jgi:hypothetical protein